MKEGALQISENGLKSDFVHPVQKLREPEINQFSKNLSDSKDH